MVVDGGASVAGAVTGAWGSALRLSSASGDAVGEEHAAAARTSRRAAPTIGRRPLPSAALIGTP